MRDNTPPLYYLLLTAWIHLAGQSESAIRLLTAVFGTLFVAAMVWVGGQIIGRYEVVAFPAYSLLVGLALAKVPSVPNAGFFLSPIVAFFFFSPIAAKLVLYYQAPPQRLERPTAAAIHKLVNNGDAVILTRVRANTTIY